MSDENACILGLCQENLYNNVRRCVLKTFNNYLDRYNSEFSDMSKTFKQKRSMKRFQQKLKYIAKKEDSDDLHEDFYEELLSSIDYLDTLLSQIAKLKIQILKILKILTIIWKE